MAKPHPRTSKTPNFITVAAAKRCAADKNTSLVRATDLRNYPFDQSLGIHKKILIEGCPEQTLLEAFSKMAGAILTLAERNKSVGPCDYVLETGPGDLDEDYRPYTELNTHKAPPLAKIRRILVPYKLNAKANADHFLEKEGVPLLMTKNIKAVTEQLWHAINVDLSYDYISVDQAHKLSELQEIVATVAEYAGVLSARNEQRSR